MAMTRAVSASSCFRAAKNIFAAPFETRFLRYLTMSHGAASGLEARGRTERRRG
jgi:hypothetical protein